MKTPSPLGDRCQAEVAGSSLSVHRSFVVSLLAGGAIEDGELSGRVEHVASGEAADFRSTAQLVSFLRRVLGGQAAK